MGLRSFSLCCFLLIFGASLSFGVNVGATRNEVITELGQPLSHAGFGDREILTYPKKIRITLEDGHVVSSENLVLKVVDPTPTPKPTENPVEVDTPVAPVPTDAPVVTPLPTERPKVKPVPSPAPANLVVSSKPVATPKPTASAADEAAELGVPAGADLNAIPTMMAKMGVTITPTPALGQKSNTAVGASQFRPTSLFDATELPLPGKAMLLAFHFGITLIIIYFAFRIWNMDALPSGIIAIAAIDVALHAGFEALGPYTSGLSTMSAVENGIPGIVMIFTIQHFSFNKKIPDAVKIASAVKIAVFVVKLIATAAMLDFVFPHH